ncbi:MAG: hypothetical protein M0Z49_11100 [Chloroflexi bacterium]|nr:hypothetical protein [Chloroflexota bacterium]
MGLTSFGLGNRHRHPLATSFVLGIGAGILTGLLVSVLPIASAALLVVGLFAMAVALVRNDALRSLFTAGILVAAGGYLAFGAISTIVACSQTDDFCGQANVWPLALIALATFGAGALAAVITVTRQRAR